MINPTGSTHNLFRLDLDLFTVSTKPRKTISSFLSFKGLTQTYLVKTSITHNKYLTARFFDNNKPISAKSAAQVLSLSLT